MASPSSVIDPAKRPPLCATAPVLNSLLPLVAGILAARALPEVWIYPILPALGAAVALRRSGPVLVAVMSFLAGLFLMQRVIEPPDPLWRELPPREVRMELRIDEVFNARKPGRIAGTGTIQRSGIPHDTVRGRRAAFYLESGPMGERPPVAGEAVECRAVLTYLPRLEEHDDYQAYLLGRDIFLTLNRGEVLRLARPPPQSEQRRHRLYRKFQDILTTGCQSPEDPGLVLASMLLGNRSLLNDERIGLYRRTGTYHLFAVSGLHVGSIALCLHLLCGLARLPAAWRILPALAGTWSYVWLTGASPSAVRAGIMISCLGLARCLFRQPHLFPALALSAWIVLLVDPAQLFQLGFQLSYGVVAAILLVGLPLAGHLRSVLFRPDWHRQPRPRWRHATEKGAGWALDLACVSISAAIGSMPLIVQHFHLFTPGGTLVGILLNPLASLVVMAGCLAMLSGLLQLSVPAGWIAMAAWPAIRLMEWLLGLCLRVPGAVSERSWAWPHTGACLLGLSLGIAWMLQRLRQRGFVLPAAAYVLPHLIVLAGLALTTVHT